MTTKTDLAPLLRLLGADDMPDIGSKRALLIGDATIPSEGMLLLFVSSAHARRIDAIASIRHDGINPLPRLLVDFDEEHVAVLEYDPVDGMHIPERISFTDLLDGDVAEALSELLGHED